MKNLFLLRHAEAAPSYPDCDRELTEHGREQTRAIAALLAPKLFKGLTCIEHSPFTRASQTAALIQEHLLPNLSLRTLDDITPEDDSKRIASQLHASPTDRFIVGHNPHLELLAHLLLQRETLLFELPKTGFIWLRLSGPANHRAPHGQWELRAFLPPKATGASVPHARVSAEF